MDDDKLNEEKKQAGDSQNINSKQEVVEVENQPSIPPQSSDEQITPEEVAPDIAAPTDQDIQTVQSGSSDVPPPIYEENKNKYIFIIGGVVLFFVFFILILSFLLGGGRSKKITLAYWGLWEDQEIFAAVIALYQQKNPNITVNYQKMSPTDYREKLLSRSKIEQGPDIFRFHNTWLPEISDVAAALPAKIMSNEEFEKTFYKIHQSDLKIGNFYYGLPLEIDGLVLVYNDDLFKKIGIATPPTNWDEMTEIVNKFSQAVDKDGRPITPAIALGTVSNVDHFSDILGLLIVQNGGSIKKIDSPEAAGALESYRKFAEEPNKIWTEDYPPSTTAFIQEKVAMIIVPSWQILTIKNANPDIKLKVAAIPSVPSARPVSLANYWIEGVSRYGKNQQEAWKFLRYLVEKDTLTKLFETQAKTRLFGEPYSRVDMSSLLLAHQYLGPVIKQADYYVSAPVVSRTYDNGLNDEIVTYLGNAVNETMQAVSYSQALVTAKKGIDQVFARYKIE